MVDKMPYSEFVRYLKCAYMLECQEGLARVQQNNFTGFTDKAREQITRDLKNGATHYIAQKVLDYKEVVANLARKLQRGR